MCRRCADLLSQAQHHVSRARKMEDEEREQREKQEREREEIISKHLEEEVDRYMRVCVSVLSRRGGGEVCVHLDKYCFVGVFFLITDQLLCVGKDTCLKGSAGELCGCILVQYV